MNLGSLGVLMVSDSFEYTRLEGGNRNILLKSGVSATLKLAACEMLRLAGRTKAFIRTEACTASLATKRREAERGKRKGPYIKFTAVIERKHKGCGVTFFIGKADLVRGAKILEQEGVTGIFDLEGRILYWPGLLAKFENLRKASN